MLDINGNKTMDYLIAIGRKCKNGDVEMTTPSGLVFTFNRDYSNKPDYRNKYVLLNCWRYNIMWDKRK